MEDYFAEITKFYTQTPISSKKNFFGRELEQSNLYKSLLAPGRQSCVYGERGVGKTSLLNVVTNYFCQQHKYKSVRHTCSKTDTFESIFSTLFIKTGKDKFITEEKEKENLKTGVKLKIPIAEIGGNIASETEKNYKSIYNFIINPEFVSSTFESEKVVFVIDEFDRIQNNNTQLLIAETIKTLSDSNSSLKLIISGVSQNTKALIGEHPSINRNLKPIKVNRMPDEDLEKIINHGEKSLNLSFDSKVKKFIILLSNGLPYFTHLLSENLADNAFYKREFNIKIENLIEIISLITDNEIFHDSSEAVLSCLRKNNNMYQPLFDFGQEMHLIIGKQKQEEDYVKKIVLFSCTFLEKLSNESMISFINELKVIDSSLKLDHIDETDIILALEDLNSKAKILVQIGDDYFFADSFVRTFTFLKGIEFFNKNTVPNILYK
jgi:Cdc6-like AAA superfamily ATPase